MEEEKLLKLYEILIDNEIINPDKIDSELFLSDALIDDTDDDYTVEYNGILYKILYQDEIGDLFYEYREEEYLNRRRDLINQGFDDIDEFVDWYEYKACIDVNLPDLFNYTTLWVDEDITILEMYKR